MKTKTLILVCLLFGIGLGRVSAQNSNSEGTKSVSYWTDDHFWSSIYCNGVWVDFISGIITWHIVEHYKDGVIQQLICQGKGEVKSEYTGETFQVSELDKIYSPKSNLYIWNTFLKGDMGTHYMVSFTCDLEAGTCNVTRSGCPGNEMNNGKNDK